MIKKDLKKGFTLVETLVAVAIIGMTIAAPLTIASNGLNAAYYARDRLIAVSLAQDALEHIRFYRDRNRLNGQSWLYELSECISDQSQNPNDRGCAIDSARTIPPPWTIRRVLSNGSCNMCGPLKYDSVTGLYGYKNEWPNSKFTRRVELFEIASGREIRVEVTITWRSNPLSLSQKSITIIENLNNVQVI
jgi:prepilin-type N-terminal cleavage/methylation domain-containing protein